MARNVIRVPVTRRRNGRRFAGRRIAGRHFASGRPESGAKNGDKKGQRELPFFAAASLRAKAGDEAGITSLLPCR
jgi:hypothetical protein